jgi:hypothetical protein
VEERERETERERERERQRDRLRERERWTKREREMESHTDVMFGARMADALVEASRPTQTNSYKGIDFFFLNTPPLLLTPLLPHLLLLYVFRILSGERDV